MIASKLSNYRQMWLRLQLELVGKQTEAKLGQDGISEGAARGREEALALGFFSAITRKPTSLRERIKMASLIIYTTAN